MANPEKAVYEDVSDDNYIDPFDEEDSDNERGPIVVVIALITLAALLAVLWVGVNLGRREGPSGPTIIAAEKTPAKSVPENRGGLQIPHTDKTVFDAINGKTSEEPEELLPPPEEPLILPEAPTPDVSTTAGTEQGGTDAANTDIDVAQAQDALTNLIEEQTETTPEPVADAPTSPDVQAALSPPPGTQTPPAIEEPVTPEPVAEVPTAPDELQLEFEKVAEPEEALTVVAEPAAAAITDPYLVQVTSVRTKNDALVAWDGLETKFGSLMSGYEPDIQTVDLGTRGIYHRLRVGPLDGRDAAQNLCSQFKQKGQDCLIVKP